MRNTYEKLFTADNLGQELVFENEYKGDNVGNSVHSDDKLGRALGCMRRSNRDLPGPFETMVRGRLP